MKFLELSNKAARPLFVAALAWTAAFDLLLFLLADPLRPAAFAFAALKWGFAAVFVVLQRRSARAEEWKRPYWLSKVALFYAVSVQGFQHFYAVSLLPTGAGKYLAFYASLLTVVLPAVAFYALRFGNRALLAAGVLVREKGKTRHDFGKGPLLAVLDWVDAVAGAFVLVIYVNALLVQCYVIPSGSMERTFLIGDRVASVKVLDGIEPPFSDVKLPRIGAAGRGDVVVLHNPRIPEAERRSVRFIVGQYLQFLSSAFTPDNAAQAVAEPLVKRVVGLPGERLTMVNDVVYVETAGGAPRPLGEPYAQVYANAASATGMSPEAARVLETDAWVAALDLAALEASTRAALGRLEPRFAANRGGPGLAAALGGAPEVSRFADLAVGLAGSLARGALDWAEFRAFFLGPYAAAPSDLHAAQAARVDAWLKLRLLEGVAALLSGPEAASRAFDDERLRYLAGTWLLRHYDARNFSPFPADGYLGPDEYFLMGDNRYNSLDGRHLEFAWDSRPLWSGDPSSLAYPSLLEPFAIPARHFLARPLFTYWPPARIGAVR